MSTHPTTTERAVFVWMQGRMVELLLRYDVQRFGATFDERVQDVEQLDDPQLARYRELAVVFYLRDELFESILPRIKRRLSFVAPRELLVEDLPPRGRIDWNRTLAATWRERPGEPPLEVHTRQRRRHFTTPENLLTVITLLEYQAAVQRLLDGETLHDRALSLRHPLHDIVASCTRELVFPQFAGLVQTSEAIIAGRGTVQVGELEAAVAQNLLPGRNNAYDELLAWRHKLRNLRLLDRTVEQLPQPMLGADPGHDNGLYQLWLCYELIELLHRRGRIVRWSTKPLEVVFTWGQGDDCREYRLHYDRQVASKQDLWQHAPGVRPDYYIERTDWAARAVFRDTQRTARIWREPGYVLDAKYYRPKANDDPKSPSGPIKRMIADLNLMSERHGMLLFAFHGADEGSGGTVAPDVNVAQFAAPDVTIIPRRIPPADRGTSKGFQARLEVVVHEVHAALKDPVGVRCRGIFLDTLSAAEQAGLADRAGNALGDDLAELLVCPKPHIGPWRVDLVSRQIHCCKDPVLCHIAGHDNPRPPVRPPRSAEDLLKELQHIFGGDARPELDQAEVQAVARRVEALTRRFAEIAGVYKRIEVFFHRLRDLGMAHTFDLLARAEQESLALAVFLVEQLDSVGATDFSAPAIHVSSVLEVAIQHKVALVSGISSAAFPHGKPTLGSLPALRRRPERIEDWQQIQAHLRQHWQRQIACDEPDFAADFDLFLDVVQQIAHTRNKAAHTRPVSRAEYSTLFRITCQGGPLRIGALNVLLLAWQERAMGANSRE